MPSIPPRLRKYLHDGLYPLRWASESVALRVGRRENVDGIVVVDTTSDAAPEHFDRIRTALVLIREIDPRRYRGSITELRHILLVRLGGGDVYAATRTGTLRFDLVEDRPAPALMLPLIALAARARLRRHAVRMPPTVQRTRRIELAVVREQERFRDRMSPDRFTELDRIDDYLRALRDRYASPS